LFDEEDVFWLEVTVGDVQVVEVLNRLETLFNYHASVFFSKQLYFLKPCE
jgi:hypothetical protein